MTTLNPYISFRGTAREAMEYYAALFGGELTLSTFRDFGMPGVADEELDGLALATAHGVAETYEEAGICHLPPPCSDRPEA